MSLVNSPPPDASGTLRGLVNLVAQTFAGVKTFVGAVIMSAGLTLNGVVNQMVRITPPSTSGTAFTSPTMWFELTGANQTRLIQFGGGLTSTTWEFALGYFSGAGASIMSVRTTGMYFDAPTGAFFSPIVAGVVDLGDSSHSWRSLYADLIRLNPAGVARPTADAANRGTVWYSKSAGGAADTVQICLKSAADTYSWVTIATG